MGLPRITFTKAQGGLGRPLQGEDHISGLVLYDNTLPSGFNSSNRIKQVFQIEDAEDLGIVDDYSDETKATGSYLVTNAGATGDTIEIKVAEPAETVSLGTYTRISTDTTVSLVATAIAAEINAGTSTHGYTAIASTATVTITASPGLGIFLNSGSPLSTVIVGTIAGTITQFTGGVASKLAIYHYHIAEYFRRQPQGNLFVGIFAVPSGSYDFTEVATLQNFTGGKVRQCAVYTPLQNFSSAHLTTLQGVQDTLEAIYKPLSILYAADLVSVSNLTNLTDLSTLEDSKVSAVIGQDGAALGYELFKSYGKSVSCLGAALGAVSLAKVSEDIAWVGKFNMSDGTELDVPAFANGTLVKDVSEGLQGSISDKRYIALRKFVGDDGTYFTDSHCAIGVDSDYAYIENNRTIDKAVRGVYAALLPALNSPLTVNADGTLSDTTIAYFESLSEGPLDAMIRDQELSARQVLIDSSQDVLSTSTLSISIKLVPIGVARNIDVTIGFTVKI